MKIELTGWRRQIHQHSHTVTPVSRSGTNLYPNPELMDAKWEDALTISGKVQGLALSGDFYLRCQFTETELHAWFLEYAKSNPRKAKRLIDRAHDEMRNTQGRNE